MHRRTRLAALAALVAPLSSLPLACASSPNGDSPRPDAVSPPAPTTVSAALAPTRDLTFGAALPDEAPAHLAFALRLDDEAGLAQLLRDQQDPASPSYRAWLTPQQFGARFGLPEATYARVAAWLAAEGFSVTQYPNRLFVEGTGTVAGVRRLLGVQPRWASKDARVFRSHAEDVALPPDIAPHVIKIGGLDTRVHLRHRLNVVYQGMTTQALGAADMRLLYDVPSAGAGASGMTTVVLGTQEGTQSSATGNPGAPFIPPSTTAIQQYLTTIASATATYNPIVMPNTNNDFDMAGSNQEYQLDVEMQSVGAPNAKNIDLVLAPSSEVFMTGAQYIVNTLSTASVVSSSLGDCESEEMADDAGPATPGSEAYVLRQAVQQGAAEGQTWFAAAGDDGADDCADQSSGTHNGFGGGNATVDFPCSIPEIVCVGGTQFENETASTWTGAGALAAYQTESVWNEGAQGGAGGGGQSNYYAKPSYQMGVGPNASDSTRDVPDIALTAATANPGVAVYDCGSGQDKWTCQGENTGAGSVDIFGGTSVASPLAAGLFASLSGQLGCRLGDIHAAVYRLGLGQADGGAQPFHDITSGNNSFVDPVDASITGFSAGPGYDLASGWGSLDMAKLIDSWPPCTMADGGVSAPQDASGPTGPTGGSEDGGTVVTGGEDSGVGGGVGGGEDAGGSGNGASGGGGKSGCAVAGVGSEASGAWTWLAAGLGLTLLRARSRARRRADSSRAG